MKKPDITPGKWMVVDGHYPGFQKVVDGAGNEVYHEVISAPDITGEMYSQRIANARAIAAVPDMIETLIESYHTIKGKVDRWGERKEHHPMLPVLTQIKTTLRKAGVTEE